MVRVFFSLCVWVFFLCLSLKREGMADQPLKSAKHFFREIVKDVS